MVQRIWGTYDDTGTDMNEDDAEREVSRENFNLSLSSKRFDERGNISFTFYSMNNDVSSSVSSFCLPAHKTFFHDNFRRNWNPKWVEVIPPPSRSLSPSAFGAETEEKTLMRLHAQINNNREYIRQSTQTEVEATQQNTWCRCRFQRDAESVRLTEMEISLKKKNIHVG